MLITSSARRILSEGNTHRIFLEIFQLGKKDSGAYKVTAKNSKGDGAANIQLNIEGIEFRCVSTRCSCLSSLLRRLH